MNSAMAGIEVVLRSSRLYEQCYGWYDCVPLRSLRLYELRSSRCMNSAMAGRTAFLEVV